MTKQVPVFEKDSNGNTIERKVILYSNDGGITFFSNPDTEGQVRLRKMKEFQVSPLTAKAKKSLDILDHKTSVIFHGLDVGGMKAAVRYSFNKRSAA